MKEIFKLYYELTDKIKSTNDANELLDIFEKMLNLLNGEKGVELYSSCNFIFDNTAIIVKNFVDVRRSYHESYEPRLNYLVSNFQKCRDKIIIFQADNMDRLEDEGSFDLEHRKFKLVNSSNISTDLKFIYLTNSFERLFEITQIDGIHVFDENQKKYNIMARVLSNLLKQASNDFSLSQSKIKAESILDVYYDFERDFKIESFDAEIVYQYYQLLTADYEKIMVYKLKDIKNNVKTPLEIIKHMNIIFEEMLWILDDCWTGGLYFETCKKEYISAYLLMLNMSSKLLLASRNFNFQSVMGKTETLMSRYIYYIIQGKHDIEVIVDCLYQGLVKLSASRTGSLIKKTESANCLFEQMILCYSDIDEDSFEKNKEMLQEAYKIMDDFKSKTDNLSNKSSVNVSVKSKLSNLIKSYFNLFEEHEIMSLKLVK